MRAPIFQPGPNLNTKFQSRDLIRLNLAASRFNPIQFDPIPFNSNSSFGQSFFGFNSESRNLLRRLKRTKAEDFLADAAAFFGNQADISVQFNSVWFGLVEISLVRWKEFSRVSLFQKLSGGQSFIYNFFSEGIFSPQNYDVILNF